MNKGQATYILKNFIEYTDLSLLKGFDINYDDSWFGSYECDNELRDGTNLLFQGEIEFSFDKENGVSDIKIIHTDYFEHYNSEGETITNYKK